ncbi:MAG: hypothetical protein IRZ33_10320 [Alicyclobacillaceae bacterium]|nr:hypothetical protein [Alicyclobacillaceae bacterium]
MTGWRTRRAGTGVSTLYANLVSTASGLVVLGMLLIFPSLLHVRQVLETAAQNGARVAALTDDPAQAQQAVQETLDDANLPQSYHGQTLWTVDEVATMDADPASPVVKVTVHYNAPILFPNLFAGLGAPNSLPATVPMSASASAPNEAYFTGPPS